MGLLPPPGPAGGRCPEGAEGGWRWLLALLAVLLAACAPAPFTATAAIDGQTVTISASRPGFSVELRNEAGVPLARGVAAADTTVVALPAGTVGEVTVHVVMGGASTDVQLEVADPAATIEVVVPPGSPPQHLRPGEFAHATLLEGTTTWARYRYGDTTGSFEVGGHSVLLTMPVGGSIGPSFGIGVQTLTLAEAGRRLAIADVVFPATESGFVDLVRPSGRVTLPSPWWRGLLDSSGLGVRARDEFTAWAWTAIRLRNEGSMPMDVVVRSRIVGPDGQPDPAFRPRVRAADDGTGNTSVLLRVPAGASATATIPLFVEEAALGNGPWTRVIEVLPLGLDAPLLTRTDPLFVSRSSSWLAAGLALTLTASAAGVALVLLRVRRWLREFDTASLVTIALFGALTFVAGTVGQLLGLGAAAAAGPFATMVTGLVDDALQATLLGALITVLPRPGSATLTVLVAWLLRGIATGTLSPMDIAFVSCRIATLEGGLWLFGLTRGGAWREASRVQRVVRLGLGLAVGSFTGTAASLVLHAALFRLYFAPWYVAMVLIGPGFLYVLAAAGVADRVATQLRRVED